MHHIFDVALGQNTSIPLLYAILLEGNDGPATGQAGKRKVHTGRKRVNIRSQKVEER